MSPLYRNRETEKTQFHPVSGLGDTFNSDEIDATGHPVNKPRVPLGSSQAEVGKARKAQKPTTGSKTTGTKAGDTNEEEQ